MSLVPAACRVAAIARWTAVEMLRERILYVVLLFAALLVASSSVLTPLAPGAQQKVVVDFGLAAIDLLSVLVILLSGSTLVRREMERRSLDILLSKPLARGEYLLGKCLGLLATLVVLTAAMTGILIVSLEAAGIGWQARYFTAILGSGLAMMVMASIAVFFSTFTSPTLAGLATLALFVAGNLSEGMLRLLSKDTGGGLLEAASLAVPSLGLFNLRGEVVHGVRVPPERVIVSAAYALAYATTALAFAAWIFRRRDFR